MGRILNIFPFLESANWLAYLAIFYCDCFIISLTFILIIYNQTSSEKNSTALSWVGKLLSSWLSVLTVFLYLPVIEVLLSIFDCKETEAGYIHLGHSEITCFSGQHIIHCVVSIIFFILIVSLTLTTSYLLHDVRVQPSNNTSDTDGHYDVWLTSYKTCLGILNILVKWIDFRDLLWIYMIFGTGLLCIKFNWTRKFLYSRVQKIFKCFNLMNLWSSLVFGYVMAIGWSYGPNEIHILISGMILLAIITFIERTNDWQLAVNDIKLCRNSTIVIQRILVFLEVISDEHNGKKEDIFILNSYISKNDDLTDKSRMDMKLILVYANKMFSEGIKLFPRSKELLLLYCNFLIRIANNESAALEKLELLETMSPSFENQCAIYHYKQIIKDQLMRSKLSIRSLMIYENHYRIFKEKIEKVTILYQQFWNLLLDDLIDLSRLVQIGFCLEKLIEEIEIHWKRMQKIHPDSYKALNLYSAFLDQVINESDVKHLLDSQRKNWDLRIVDMKSIQLVQNTDLLNISSEGDPCICVSGNQGKIGIITQCNAALCRLFGYTKAELIGKNIDILMPDIFARDHTKRLKKDLEKNEVDWDNNKKELKVYGKTKNGYIIKLWLNILSRPTLLNEDNYVGVMRIDKTLENEDSMILLLNEKKMLVGMSSSAILIMDVQNNLIECDKVDFNNLFPELNIESQLMNIRNIKTKLYLSNINLLKTDTQANIKDKKKFPMRVYSLDLRNEVTTKHKITHLDVKLHIETLYSKDKILIGYSIEVSIISEKRPILDKEFLPSEFQFEYNPMLNQYVRVFGQRIQNPLMRSSSIIDSHTALFKTPTSNVSQHDEIEVRYTNKDLIKEAHTRLSNFKSIFFQTLCQRVKALLDFYNTKSFPLNDTANTNIATLLNNRATDYERNIKTYVLINDYIQDVTGKSMNDLNGHYENTEIKQVAKTHSASNKTTRFLTVNSLKSKKSLQNLLVQGKTACSGWIAYIMYSLFCIILCVSIVNYVYFASFLDSIITHVNLINSSYQRIIYEQVIMYYTKEMIFLKGGYLTHYEEFYEMNEAEYFEFLKTHARKESNNLYTTHKDLLRKTNKLSDSDIYLEQTNERNIEMSRNIQENYTLGKNLSLSETILRLVSSAFEVSNVTFNESFETSGSMDFIVSNGNNGIMIGIITASTLYFNQFENYLKSNSALFIAILALMLVFILVVLLALTIIINAIENSKMTIYSLFLDIPNRQLKNLCNRTETFINSLRNEDMDESTVFKETSEEEANADENEADEFSSYYEGKSKKKFKNLPNLMKRLLIIFALFYLVLCCFFVCQFCLYSAYRSRALKVVPAFNKVIKIVSPLYNLMNSIREYMYDQIDVMYDMDVHEFFLYTLSLAYEQTMTIDQFNVLLSSIVSSFQLNEMEEILFDSICGRVTYFASLNDCEAFARGLTQQGVTALIVDFTESIRVVIRSYENGIRMNQTRNSFLDSPELYSSCILPLTSSHFIGERNKTII